MLSPKRHNATRRCSGLLAHHMCYRLAAQEGIGSTQPGFKTIQVCPRTCRLACGPLNVSLEQTMLPGTPSHPNVAYTPSYRLMAHTSRMLEVISCVAAFTVSGCAAEPTQIN